MNTILQIIESDGSCIVSEGTLRNQDLIPKFLNAIKILDEASYDQIVSPANGHSTFPHHARDDEDDNWWVSQEAYDLLSQLEDCLGELSPEGFYFGAHEGDGANYGFWPEQER